MIQIVVKNLDPSVAVLKTLQSMTGVGLMSIKTQLENKGLSIEFPYPDYDDEEEFVAFVDSLESLLAGGCSCQMREVDDGLITPLDMESLRNMVELDEDILRSVDEMTEMEVDSS